MMKDTKYLELQDVTDEMSYDTTNLSTAEVAEITYLLRKVLNNGVQ